MTVDARIKAALDAFGDPVENAVYTGSENRYYVFNYITTGALFADDDPSAEHYFIQVHLFAPLDENVTERIKQTKQALNKAGFTWPETTNATDDEARHIVFECEYVEGVD